MYKDSSVSAFLPEKLIIAFARTKVQIIEIICTIDYFCEAGDNFDSGMAVQHCTAQKPIMQKRPKGQNHKKNIFKKNF